MDFLAVRPGPKGAIERRQVEVQCSYRPVSYISPVPKAVRAATGRGSNNARKRDEKEVRQGVKEWVEKKYAHPQKEAIRQKLCPGKWTRELVVHVVRHPIELQLFGENGVLVHQLADVVAQMMKGARALDGAAGSSLFDLVALTTGLRKAGA
ncbi:MAG: hypothetical protein ACREMZ_11170 [Gemmatimonadales bacterium]